MKKHEIKLHNASLILINIDDNLFSMKLENFDGLSHDQINDFVFKFNEFVIDNKCQIMSFDLDSYGKRNEFLNKTNLYIDKTKILFSKDLTNEVEVDLSKYDFIPCDRISKKELYLFFQEVSKGDLEVGLEYEKYLDEVIQMAGSAFDISEWKIARYLNNEIGLICPQLYPDGSKEGSMFYIGILPKYRRQNHGLTIHAHGLNLLKCQGAKTYIGSTSIKNQPMLKIFKTNHCIEKYSQIYYKYEN